MLKSLLRSCRKTVTVFSSPSQVGVDNVTKTISFRQWRVPFEWLLDRDTEAFDANSQRTCMISPSLAKDLELLECKADEDASGALTISALWGNPLPCDPSPPPHCTPSTIPARSSIVIGSDASEVRDVARRRPLGTKPQVEGLLGDSQELWTKESLVSPSPHLPPDAAVVPDFFRDEMNNKHKVVRTIERFGFAVVEDPALQSCQGGSSAPNVVQNRCDAAERMITSIFSFIRNSHYGAMSTWSDNNAWKDLVVGEGVVGTNNKNDGRFRESPAHLDGAYQSSLLDLHTDCTYFVECPKLQAFGCILTTPSTVGGATTLSDGAAAAMMLSKEFPEYFELLTQIPVGGRYKKEGWWYEGFRPVISLSPNGRRIERIAFNNSDRIPLDLSIACEEMKTFYRAYYAFHRVVQQNAIEFLLRPGQLLFFDNHRVLHGRLKFAGPRVMCGAYIGSDEYLSALRSAFAHEAL